MAIDWQNTIEDCGTINVNYSVYHFKTAKLDPELKVIIILMLLEDFSSLAKINTHKKRTQNTTFYLKRTDQGWVSW